MQSPGIEGWREACRWAISIWGCRLSAWRLADPCALSSARAAPDRPQNCLRPTRGAPLANTCRRRLSTSSCARSNAALLAARHSIFHGLLFPDTQHEGQRARQSRRVRATSCSFPHAAQGAAGECVLEGSGAPRRLDGLPQGATYAESLRRRSRRPRAPVTSARTEPRPAGSISGTADGPTFSVTNFPALPPPQL